MMYNRSPPSGGAARITGALLAAAVLLPPAQAMAAPVAQAAARSSGLRAAFDREYPSSDALYAALKVAAKGMSPNPKAWRGTWTRQVDGLRYFFFGIEFKPNPPLPDEYYSKSEAQLTPEYQAKYDKKIDDLKKGIEWDQLSSCLPAGFPRWLTEPFLREFIVTPEETWMIAEQQSEVRRIYTDGRGHVPEDEAYPLWEGDSIGFWAGDTLVIHTNHLKPGQYQRGLPDYSDQTSTVELVRQISPTQIEDLIVVFDPLSLTKPLRARFLYELVPDAPRINMWSCNENNNVVKTSEGSSDFVLPGEKGYKDPNALLQGPSN